MCKDLQDSAAAENEQTLFQHTKINRSFIIVNWENNSALNYSSSNGQGGCLAQQTSMQTFCGERIFPQNVVEMKIFLLI